MAHNSSSNAFKGALGHFIPQHFFSDLHDKMWAKNFIQELTDYSFNLNSIRKWDKIPSDLFSESDFAKVMIGKIRQLYLFYNPNNNSTDFDKEIKKQCQYIFQLCDQRKELGAHSESQERLILLAQSYASFVFAMQTNHQTQRKMILVSSYYLNELSEKVSEHPYLLMLMALNDVALNRWDEATNKLHRMSRHYPHSKLYEVLSKLYIKIELPQVAKFFQHKANLAQNKEFVRDWAS